MVGVLYCNTLIRMVSPPADWLFGNFREMRTLSRRNIMDHWTVYIITILRQSKKPIQFLS
jgi:hypothetical protein